VVGGCARARLPAPRPPQPAGPRDRTLARIVSGRFAVSIPANCDRITSSTDSGQCSSLSTISTSVDQCDHSPGALEYGTRVVGGLRLRGQLACRTLASPAGRCAKGNNAPTRVPTRRWPFGHGDRVRPAPPSRPPPRPCAGLGTTAAAGHAPVAAANQRHTHCARALSAAVDSARAILVSASSRERRASVWSIGGDTLDPDTATRNGWATLPRLTPWR
jgi:hypothetical protein